MHPILQNRARLLVYLAAWVLLGLLFGMLLSGLPGLPGRPFERAAAETVPLALIYGFICLSAWWVCRALPLGRTPASRLAAGLLTAAALASLSWALLAAGWVRTLEGFAAHSGRAAGDMAVNPPAARTAVCLAVGIPLYLFSAALHYLIAAFEDSRRAERRALESQVVAREAELRALRAQLNPHFLFNSLNSINALVGHDPEAARRMCEGLGDFLRQTLALGAHETVSLGEELELIEKYLAIEQVRFGARLGVAIEATPAVRACRIPPLLLQPLVENAVKHGIAAQLAGGTVEIRARRDGDAVVIEVTNPLDPDAAARHGQGLGLDNVRRRLRAFDPRRASVVTREAGARFTVVLTLPADKSPPEAV